MVLSLEVRFVCVFGVGEVGSRYGRRGSVGSFLDVGLCMEFEFMYEI